MITVQTFNASNLPAWAAEGMLDLTNEDSAQSRWLKSLAAGDRNPEVPDDLIYAVLTQDLDFEISVVGWASVHHWQGMPALEGYVSRPHREQRLASVLCCVVTAAANVPRTGPIAVFAPACASIARWLGFATIHHYKRVDDGWITIND